MSDRSQEFIAFYERHRFDDQLAYYRARVREYDSANTQASWTTGIVLIAASGVAFVAASGIGVAPLAWRILAATLPAVSAAIAAFQRLFAFEHVGKLFQDAVTAMLTLGARPMEESDAEISGYVSQLERIFAREQGQWGQLTADLQTPEQGSGDAGHHGLDRPA